MAEVGSYARIAVVTGAARGVGAAVARRLARRGMRLALLGRELDSLRQVAAGLPTEAHCFEVDVTDEAALQGAARSVGTRLGPASV
ncbi:SDR family NAD(P)-dependent oxidoreductase, partial [Streptomyces katrae]|uniref:SDR family NAD(P)-dependent oxidoreductase n=2 Tax=Streptomyces TaxID=1883 RepID=UPI0012FF55D5